MRVKMGCWNPSHQANFRPFLSCQQNFWPLVNLAFSTQLASNVPKRLRMPQHSFFKELLRISPLYTYFRCTHRSSVTTFTETKINGKWVVVDTLEIDKGKLTTLPDLAVQAQLTGTSLNSLKLLSVSVSVSVSCSSDAPSLAEFATVIRLSPTKVIWTVLCVKARQASLFLLPGSLFRHLQGN